MEVSPGETRNQVRRDAAMLTALLSCMLSGFFFLVLHVTGSGSFPRPLTAAEERACLARLCRGDKTAKSELVEHNLRLVAHIVKNG